ncbi:hypothetical protein [Corynebacterium sp. KPL4042]|uniref:hypothetical protein n=1 Tax=Corynebacterium sp. KPL4042 TaxID=3158327 RepID=UPI0032EE3E6C
MPNPTRQEIVDAYTAVTTLARLAEEFTPVRVEEHKEINDLHLAVRAALPTKPKPTMAEVEWDDNKHYLAEAESESGVKVVMLSQNRDFIRCIQPPNAGDVVIGVPSEDLTPTGRRYTPTEVQE